MTTATRRACLAVAAMVLAVSAPAIARGEAATPSAPVDASGAAMGSLAGNVTAARPFKAAQVYIRNVDKRVLYMVYTHSGAFRAVALFPGRYEIDVQAKGLESDVSRLTIKTGEHARLNLTMHESSTPDFSPSALKYTPPTEPNAEEFPRVVVQSYDEVYPPGAVRQTIEQKCLVCHDENYLPSRPRSEAAWNAAALGSERACLSGSIVAPPAAMFRLNAAERREVLAYLVQNFGADRKPRAVRTDAELPLDEVKLGRAQFIEYYLPGGTNPSSAADPKNANSMADHRKAFTLQLDADGNVWAVDRGVPNRLVKLDPRTGAQREFPLPDPVGGVHELLIDRAGMIWVPEFLGEPLRRDYKLLSFNPRTEQWEKQIVADPDHVLPGYREGILGTALDSHGNIYMAWIGNGYISRWERATGKMSFFRVPTPAAAPYGLATDKNDNVWSVLYFDGKLVKFDPVNEGWTEFTPLTYPGMLRRGVNVDSKNQVWFGVYAAGSRPGKLARLDQATGRITEWSIPHRDAQPYEASVDRDDAIWFPDKGSPDRPSALGRLDPRDGTFTFYPKPQFVAESPKLQHAASGAVWYAPRFGAPAGWNGFGVLYPDKDRITSLAAYPLNGPPGYAYEAPTARSTAN